MAKAQHKKATNSSHQGGQPRNDDAERLAAIRWLAMKIEQVSIEVLMTDRDNFGALEDALRAEVTLLRRIGRPALPLDSDDCPGGYVLCRDGLCAPMCDGATVASSARSQAQKIRR